MTISAMKTKINVTQKTLDEAERQRLWEETRRDSLYYFQNRYQWFNYPKWNYVAPFPLHVDFEASSNCNLACPMCFRRHMEDTNVYTDMSFDLYKKGVEEGLCSVKLQSRGESMIHHDLLDLLACTKKRGVLDVHPVGVSLPY
jgi:sulfatase maturation enzyme AslB (radical SAM superfamily)